MPPCLAWLNTPPPAPQGRWRVLLGLGRGTRTMEDVLGLIVVVAVVYGLVCWIFTDSRNRKGGDK